MSGDLSYHAIFEYQNQLPGEGVRLKVVNDEQGEHLIAYRPGFIDRSRLGRSVKWLDTRVYHGQKLSTVVDFIREHKDEIFLGNGELYQKLPPILKGKFSQERILQNTRQSLYLSGIFNKLDKVHLEPKGLDLSWRHERLEKFLSENSGQLSFKSLPSFEDQLNQLAGEIFQVDLRVQKYSLEALDISRSLHINQLILRVNEIKRKIEYYENLLTSLVVEDKLKTEGIQGFLVSSKRYIEEEEAKIKPMLANLHRPIVAQAENWIRDFDPIPEQIREAKKAENFQEVVSLFIEELKAKIREALELLKLMELVPGAYLNAAEKRDRIEKLCEEGQILLEEVQSLPIKKEPQRVFAEQEVIPEAQVIGIVSKEEFDQKLQNLSSRLRPFQETTLTEEEASEASAKKCKVFLDEFRSISDSLNAYALQEYYLMGDQKLAETNQALNMAREFFNVLFQEQIANQVVQEEILDGALIEQAVDYQGEKPVEHLQEKVQVQDLPQEDLLQISAKASQLSTVPLLGKEDALERLQVYSRSYTYAENLFNELSRVLGQKLREFDLNWMLEHFGQRYQQCHHNLSFCMTIIDQINSREDLHQDPDILREIRSLYKMSHPYEKEDSIVKKPVNDLIKGLKASYNSGMQSISEIFVFLHGPDVPANYTPPAWTVGREQANINSSDIGPRIPMSEFRERVFPTKAGEAFGFQVNHPRNLCNDKIFKTLELAYPEGREVRGRNNCTYLSFALSYLNAISRDQGRLLDLLSRLQRFNMGTGRVANMIQVQLNGLQQGIHYNLEATIAFDPNISQELIQFFRLEAANYFYDSFEKDPKTQMPIITEKRTPVSKQGRQLETIEYNYVLKPGRLHREVLKSLPPPEAIQQRKVELLWELGFFDVNSENELDPDRRKIFDDTLSYQNEFTGTSLQERCQIIATPSERPSEGNEIDALARAFDVKFLSISFMDSLAMNSGTRFGKDNRIGKECKIVTYPLLDGQNNDYTIEDLKQGRLSAYEGTFALLSKSVGHTDPLFKSVTV